MAEHGDGPGRDDGERSLERERELLRSTRRQLRGVTRVLRFADLMALLMVAATAFSGWAAWRTARVTALIFSTSERPFLGVERVSLESSDTGHPAIVVQFRNFGRVPAADAIVGVHALLDGKLVQPPHHRDWRRVLAPRVPDVRAIRRKLGLSQSEFAARFGFSVRTVQEWEQGRAVPDRPARILLRVIEKSPNAVERALEPG